MIELKENAVYVKMFSGNSGSVWFVFVSWLIEDKISDMNKTKYMR